MASSFSSSVSGLASISALAQQFMQQQYAWGQQQFAANSQLTDQVVGDLMNLYGTISGIGNTLMNEYNSMFLPEYQNLVNDANSYAGRARIQQAMGAAESGVAQNFNGQRNAALADLQSFGIDPSSGRYAQLDAAERTQEAAAAAGAGFQAEQATEATGRALRSEALQLGSVMPSQATAAYNAASSAATAGENAKLANAQEGVNMMGNPTQWGQVGQQYRTSSGGSSSPNPNNNKNNSNSSKQPGLGYSPQDYLNRGNQSPDQQDNRGGSGGGGSGGGGSNRVSSDGSSNMGIQDLSGNGGFGGSGDSTNINPPFGPMGSDTAGQDGSPFYGPASDSAYNQDSTGLSNMGPDTAGQEGSPYFGPATDSADTTGDNSGGSSFDYSSSDQPSYDDSGYAEGGMLPHGKLGTGGYIPPEKSPSHGRDTDDVAARMHGTNEPIRLNAGEFIIPRHTVRWLGEKYFQTLIRKSKEARGAASARPSMKPALPSHREGYHAQH